MTGDQERQQRIGRAAWAFNALLDEIVPESAYWLIGKRQDDAKVAAYTELIDRFTQDGHTDPPTAQRGVLASVVIRE